MMQSWPARRRSSLRNPRRVVIGNQAPPPLLLYPYPGKPSVAGNSLALVLPDHRREAGLDGGVVVDAHLNLVGGDRLKLQLTRREIRNHLRLGSHRAARSDADEIIGVDAVEGRRIRPDLRLNAFMVQLPYFLLDAASLISAWAPRLPRGGRRKRKAQGGNAD